jgi:hypothetical protein
MKTIPIGFSIAMITLGLAIYASGHRKRKSFNVPFLSNHSKFSFGGSLALLGLLLSKRKPRRVEPPGLALATSISRSRSW